MQTAAKSNAKKTNTTASNNCQGSSKAALRFGCLLFLATIAAPSIAHSAITGANAAAGVICDVILMLRGRIGRALALIAIMTTAWGFMLGHQGWQRVMTLTVGFGLLFGAEGVAYIILPSTVKGIAGTTSTGKIFRPDETYTPQDIVKNVCPELAAY